MGPIKIPKPSEIPTITVSVPKPSAHSIDRIIMEIYPHSREYFLSLALVLNVVLSPVPRGTPSQLHVAVASRSFIPAEPGFGKGFLLRVISGGSPQERLRRSPNIPNFLIIRDGLY